MTADGGRAPYQSPLRARQKQQTSLAILDAVAAVLRGADLSAVTIAEVARVAEVTEQTVYRHYSSRDALVRAFVQHHLDQATGGPGLRLPNTINELLSWVEGRCQAWANDLAVVSEAYLSPIGRELRLPLYEIGFRNTSRLIAQEYPHIAPDRRAQVAAAMMSLMSTENFVFLNHTLGYSAEETAATVVNAIRAMLEGAEAIARRSPG